MSLQGRTCASIEKVEEILSVLSGHQTFFVMQGLKVYQPHTRNNIVGLRLHLIKLERIRVTFQLCKIKLYNIIF